MRNSLTRFVPALSCAALLLVLVACQSRAPVDATASIRVSPQLAARAPADLAILPIEDGSLSGGFAALDREFRERLSERLAERRYSPLSVDYVDGRMAGVGDGSPVDPNWLDALRGRFDADALLGVRIVEWNLDDVMLSVPRVRFAVDLLMVSAEDGEQLCVGRYQGSLKPGGDEAAQIGRNARIRQAAATLADNLALQIPERRVRAVGGGDG